MQNTPRTPAFQQMPVKEVNAGGSELSNEEQTSGNFVLLTEDQFKTIMNAFKVVNGNLKGALQKFNFL